MRIKWKKNVMLLKNTCYWKWSSLTYILCFDVRLSIWLFFVSSEQWEWLVQVPLDNVSRARDDSYSSNSSPHCIKITHIFLCIVRLCLSANFQFFFHLVRSLFPSHFLCTAFVHYFLLSAFLRQESFQNFMNSRWNEKLKKKWWKKRVSKKRNSTQSEFTYSLRWTLLTDDVSLFCCTRHGICFICFE